MADENFISLKSIKSNKINYEFSNGINEMQSLCEISFPIYQIQGIQDSACGLIMNVGIMEELHDVLIKEFDIHPMFKCYMISKIYNDIILKQLYDIGRIPMIKINICSNDKLKTAPIASLCYNFNPILPSQTEDKNELFANISNSIIKKELNGFYSITLHFDEKGSNKYVEIQNQKTFSGKNQMMIDLTKWLLDEKITNILKKLI